MARLTLNQYVIILVQRPTCHCLPGSSLKTDELIFRDHAELFLGQTTFNFVDGHQVIIDEFISIIILTKTNVKPIFSTCSTNKLCFD